MFPAKNRLRPRRLVSVKVSSNLASRVAAALGVRVVRREHEQLGARLLDHPADGLAGERRELQVPAHVLGRLEREALKRRLGPLERTLRVVELAQPRHDPARALLDAAAAQPREAVEEPVEDQHAEEQLAASGGSRGSPSIGRSRRRRGGRSPASSLLWNAGSSRRPPPPTCRTKGTSASSSSSQNAIEVRVRGARSPAAVDGTMTAAQPASIASRAVAVGPRRIDERHERDAAAAAGRRRRSPPSRGSGPAARVEAVEVAARRTASRRTSRTRAGRRKPKRSRTRLRSCGSKPPSRASPCRCSSRSSASRGGPGRRDGSRAPRSASSSTGRSASIALAPQPVAQLRLEERVEEAVQLHDVAVGVEDRLGTRRTSSLVPPHLPAVGTPGDHAR